MKKLTLYIAFVLLTTLAALAQSPKREFRGAWLHTVFQTQYLRNTTAQNKEYICRQLDSLAAMGVNAVIFQVRPQADAFYASRLEPWSCYLTADGKAPRPFWDPLEFIIGEAHARGMELHAWLNPYRVTSNTRQIQKLPSSHIYRKHPERFVNYGGKLYFDPALPENREFIGKVVDDIVARYDIDGIHFDDYFYPYPIAGKDFPDGKSYARYGAGMKRADWQRHGQTMGALRHKPFRNIPQQIHTPGRQRHPRTRKLRRPIRRRAAMGAKGVGRLPHAAALLGDRP